MRKTTILLVMLFMASTMLMANGCTASTGSSTSAETTVDSSATEVAEDFILTPANDTVIRPGMTPEKLTVIDFNATWCGPCRVFAPVFDKAAEKMTGKADFYSIDTDKFPLTATAFQIQAIPTIVFIAPDGKMTSCIGLNDFLEGLDMATDPTEEQATAVMLQNLCKMAEDNLK